MNLNASPGYLVPFPNLEEITWFSTSLSNFWIKTFETGGKKLHVVSNLIEFPNNYLKVTCKVLISSEAIFRLCRLTR